MEDTGTLGQGKVCAVGSSELVVVGTAASMMPLGWQLYDYIIQDHVPIPFTM